MKFRDVAFGAVLLSVLEAYLIIHFAPQLRPAGGLGRLGGRLFALNLFLYSIWLVFIYPFAFSPLRHIPGPKGGNIFVGHALQARFSKPRGDKIREWMEEIPNNGVIHFRDFFNNDAIIATSHETLKTILVDNCYDYEKQRRVVQILRTILGDGLILVEGAVHKFQRQHLLPSFQVKVIRDLYPVFWSKACETSQMLRDTLAEPEIEFGVWCTRVTLDIIGIAGFGRDFNSLKNPSDEFVEQYNMILEPDPEKAGFFALSLVFPDWLVRSIPFWAVPRNLNKISANLKTFAYNLAKERRSDLSGTKSNALEKKKSPSASTIKRNDILSLLVESNDFTDHELADQVLTMMAAGHETTSSTLSWCMYLLAKDPEMQTRVREEVRESLPSPDNLAEENVTAAQVDVLPWLNAVCNETTRLYPTVPVTTRETVKATKLGEYVLPEGTSIYLSPWAINRSTSFWGSDAMDFKPQRWINADGSVNNTGGATSNYSNLTFLHGPRSCIGQGFARSELKCLLAAVVGRYEFELTRSDDTYYSAGLVTTKPANGMWLKLKEVPGW